MSANTATLPVQRKRRGSKHAAMATAERLPEIDDSTAAGANQKTEPPHHIHLVTSSEQHGLAAIDEPDAPPGTAALPEASGESAGAGGPAPSLKGEWPAMALLLLLYFLQGLPIGLSSAVPMLLAGRGTGWGGQAVFTMASWPYSLKLLWAPVVDALWARKFKLGHRKSWIVPVQLLTGVVMVTMASRVQDLFGPGGPEGQQPGAGAGGQDGQASPQAGPDVVGLTVAFFFLYLLVATQDIAVDAWALTLLRRENVGYAGTANAVGQSAGAITAYSVFLALESPRVCDGYIRPLLGLLVPAWGIRTGTGFVTMSSFLTFWGIVFILVTLGLWLLKDEGAGRHDGPEVQGASASGDAAAPAVVSRSRSGSRTDRQRARAGAGARTAGASSSASPSSTSSLRQRSRGRRPSAAVIPASGSAATEVVQVSSSSGHSNEAGEATAQPSSNKEQSPSRTGTAAGHRGSRRAATATAEATGFEPQQQQQAGQEDGAGVEAETKPLIQAQGQGQDKPGSTAQDGGAANDTASAANGEGHGLASAWAALRTSYAAFGRLLTLRPVWTLALVLLTGKLGWQAIDRGSGLVMQGRGWPKETIASIDVASSLLQLGLQMGVLSRWSASPAPLALYRSLYPARVLGCAALLAAVYWLPTSGDGPAVPGAPGADGSGADGSSGAGTPGSGSASGIPWTSALAYFALSNVYSTVASLQFMCCMAFFARVAAHEPSTGGTVITLLNTLSNLGWALWGPLVYKAIDWGNSTGPGRDGFLLASLLGMAYSAVWWWVAARPVDSLQRAVREDWVPAKSRAGAGGAAGAAGGVAS